MPLLINPEILNDFIKEHDINDIKENEYDNYCHICKLPHDHKSVILPCNHKYHVNCLKLNIKHNQTLKCPFCTSSYDMKCLKIPKSIIKCNHFFKNGKPCTFLAKPDKCGNIVKCIIHQNVEEKNKNESKIIINCCKGTTKKGEPCKKKGSDAYDGYCYLHYKQK